MINAHYTAFQNLGAVAFSSLAFAFVLLYFALGALWRVQAKDTGILPLKRYLARLEHSYLSFKKHFHTWLALHEHSPSFA